MRLDAKRFISGQGSSDKLFLDLLAQPPNFVWQTNIVTTCIYDKGNSSWRFLDWDAAVSSYRIQMSDLESIKATACLSCGDSATYRTFQGFLRSNSLPALLSQECQYSIPTTWR